MKLKKVVRRKLVISDSLILMSPTVEEVEQIKHKLTFDNPAYRNAIRFSRYNRVSIPPSLMYYEQGKYEGEKCIKVPIGFDLASVIDDYSKLKVEDKRMFGKIDHAPFVLELRPDQQEASNEFFRLNEKTLPLNGMIQLPTGKGKSILGLHIASQLSCKTLIVVHKDDLVIGWQKDIALSFDGKVSPGLIKAKSRVIGHFLTIATVQTLSRLNDKELEELYSIFGLVIQDECLVGDTVVINERGGVNFIKDVKNGDRVVGGKVQNTFSRKSDTVKVSFSKGVIEGSPNHPTFCVKRKVRYNKVTYSESDFQVKQLKDITEDYLIPTIVKIPHVQENNYSPELTSFLALIICAGHLDKHGNRVKINVSKNREFYSEVFMRGCECFGADYKLNNDCRDNLTVWTTDRELKNYLINTFNIPTGKKNNIVEVPGSVFHAPIRSVKSFIETCFNCSGDLSKETNGHRINFNCTSKMFTVGLQMLLRKFSIVANYQEIVNRKSTLYRLSCGGIEFNKFMDTFSLIDYKMTKDRNENTMDSCYVGNYYLSGIKRVEYNETEQEVYDFEVKGTHTFIANGALTHNCHHCPANSYSVVSNFFPRYRLGLTATPERSDGLDHIMNMYYGGTCYKYKAGKEEHDILPVKVIRKRSLIYFNPLFRKFKSNKGNIYELVDLYAPQDLMLSNDQIRLSDIPYNERPSLSYQMIDNFVVTDESYKGLVCADILEEFYKGRSIVAFFTQKEHCRIYYDYLTEEVGEENVQLFYGDSKDSNADVLSRAESGQVRITLTTYAKGTEGTNVKSWEVEFLVSSINNEKNTEQAVGRIRRIKQGKISPALVYDYRVPYVYSLSNHGATRDRRYKQLGFDNEIQVKKRSIFSRGY